MTWDSRRTGEPKRVVCATKQRHITRLHTALVLEGYHAKLVDDATDGLVIEVFLPDASDAFLVVACKQIGRRWRFEAGPYFPLLGVADDVDGTVARLRNLIGPPRPTGHPRDGKASA